MYNKLQQLFKPIKDKVMATISINNNDVVGRTMIIKNKKIIVDGVDVTPQTTEITITVTGDIDLLDVDACNTVTVDGCVNNASVGVGDLTCGDVTGDAKTGTGDVKCGTVGGNVKTDVGDIKVHGQVSGNAKTGCGNIKMKR